MRFGTGTPFGKTAYPLHLYSGGTFLIPPGNFDIMLGRASILQIFDNQNYLWRTIRWPGTTLTNLSSDGVNFRIVNASGVITGASITNAGSSGTNGIGAAQALTTVSFGSAPATGRAATGYCIVGGSINTTITITAAGTGYLVPPLLVIDPPPAGGVQATAYCTLTGTTIGAVTVTNPGAGYAVVPNVTVIPQFASYTGANLIDPKGNTAITAPTLYSAVSGYSTANTTAGAVTLPAVADSISADLVGAGSGAVLTVNATLSGSGTLTGIVMTDYGANYTSVPSITFSGTGAPTSAAATALASFCVTSVAVNNAGAAVSVAPTWQSTEGLVSSNDGCNDYYGIRPAVGTTTLSSTTTTILTSLTVEDPGFGIQKVPTIGMLPTGGTAWTTNPSGTASVGGVVDTSILQRAVS